MASAAVALRERGFTVTGSDQDVIYPPMSTFLADRGIVPQAGYAESNLAHKPDLVVIGNAISRGNPEAEYVLDHKLRYCSLPELLKECFIRGKRSLVVTGTHGKTTTASLLAWVFESAGLHPSFLIGGIPANLGQGARFQLRRRQLRQQVRRIHQGHLHALPHAGLHLRHEDAQHEEGRQPHDEEEPQQDPDAEFHDSLTRL